MNDDQLTATASRLCLACGLCCNGVLFEIVRLAQTDSITQLEARGVTIRRKKRGPYFNQPCPLLNACSCTGYAERPDRCRSFECLQIQRLKNGTISETEALSHIHEAKQQASAVETCLATLGNTDTHLPLTERCSPFYHLTDQHSLNARTAELNTTLDTHFRQPRTS